MFAQGRNDGVCHAERQRRVYSNRKNRRCLREEEIDRQSEVGLEDSAKLELGAPYMKMGPQPGRRDCRRERRQDQRDQPVDGNGFKIPELTFGGDALSLHADGPSLTGQTNDHRLPRFGTTSCHTARYYVIQSHRLSGDSLDLSPDRRGRTYPT